MGRAITKRTDIDLAAVRAAIAAAEQRTAAEIVVSIAPFFLGRIWPAARRAFARLGVANTRLRNGVLVFVVPSRRQVVVLADDGAFARLEPSVWSDLATQIAAAFARGEGTRGLVDGVDALAGQLAEAYPPIADDVDELTDLHIGGFA